MIFDHFWSVRAFAQEKLFRVPGRTVCAEGRLPSERPSSENGERTPSKILVQFPFETRRFLATLPKLKQQIVSGGPDVRCHFQSSEILTSYIVKYDVTNIYFPNLPKISLLGLSLGSSPPAQTSRPVDTERKVFCVRPKIPESIVVKEGIIVNVIVPVSNA